jgi:protocatechuate 4,5-dioxygenase alpha chain
MRDFRALYTTPAQGDTPMAKAKPQENEYEDIPGTFVFNAERSRQGYGINMFCMSLMKDANRKAFKANEAGYLKKYPLTPEQTDAILKRDYNRMLELGGNIYFTAKLGATDGHSFRHLAAVMTGSTQDDYAAMMLAGRPLGGGQPIEVGQARQAGQKNLNQGRDQNLGQGRNAEIQILKKAEVTRGENHRRNFLVARAGDRRRDRQQADRGTVLEAGVLRFREVEAMDGRGEAGRRHRDL